MNARFVISLLFLALLGYIATTTALPQSELQLEPQLEQQLNTRDLDVRGWTCATTSKPPIDRDITVPGVLTPFSDGRGVCLTLNAICGTRPSPVCSRPLMETVRISRLGSNVIIETTGIKNDMDIRCEDLRLGLIKIMVYCKKNGRVEGSLEFFRGKGKANVTLRIRAN